MHIIKVIKNYKIECYLLLFAIFLSSQLFSQVTLNGKITEKKTGQPLFGANVFIPELLVGAATDTAGSYKIRNLPKRRVILKISSLGYKTLVEEEVDLTTNRKIDFSLEESPEQMDEVVVTGTSRATDLRKDPIPILVMDSKGLDQILSTNIIDAISKLPGVDARSRRVPIFPSLLSGDWAITVY